MLQHGLRALAGLAPGGSVIYEVCAAAAGEWKKSVDRADERQVIEQMLAKSRDEIKAEVAQQIAELKKHATPEQAQQLTDPKVAQGLELYLETIPDHMRASLRRPEDPSGNSVPASFSLREEHGFAAILPNRTPRFRTGDKVGNYVLTEPLGLGGFGEVWKARHVRLSSRVAAIKFCLDEASQRNLKHESSLIDRVQLLARQPGIVELWDAFLDHDPPCLVYQFIEGGDLTGLMRNLKTLPAKERETRAVEVMIALASIVAPLHAMVPPIIHRDLKPANILISRTNGQDFFWVTDFGIGALAAESALGGHRQGMSRGDLMSQSLRGTHTPVYASPEQRKHAEPDPRDDVHALAVIGFQLLMGDPTEEPGADLEDMLKHLKINEVLIQIIKDGLRTRREQRLEHAGIFADRLMRLISAQTNKQHVIKTSAEKVNDARKATELEEECRAIIKAEAERQAAILEEQRRSEVKAEAERQAAIVKEQRRAEVIALAKQDVQNKSVQDFEKGLPKTRMFDLGNGVNLEMVLIPVGTFMMGSPESEAKRSTDETLHQVTISKPYYLGKYLVTQAQWQQVMRNNPSNFKGDKLLPVENVSWDETQAFCRKLKEITQAPFGIPTEAKWEYACRAGTNTPFHFGSELNGRQANCDGTVPYGTDAVGPYLEKTTPVGKYSANAWGLHDMHGNVLEWCADWYGDYPTGSVTDPSGPATGSIRVYRGGCWNRVAVGCRSAFRFGFVPSYRICYLGFRLALSLPGNQEIKQASVKEPYPIVRAPAQPREPVAAPKVELSKTLTFDLGNGVNLEMVLITAGTFIMGSPDSEAGRRSDETQHRVTISKPFYLGKYQVTQAQWQQVMGNNPSHFKGDKLLPIENVSWDDTKAFCRKLKEITQLPFGIPTEAQWEYACRTGTTTPFHFGSELNGSQANCNGNNPYHKTEGWLWIIKIKGPNLEKTTPVGKYPANAWGLYDMHGNVFEWCSDWYGEYPSGSVTDPSGPATGSNRVIRGGSWNDDAVYCRSANRSRFGTSDRLDYLGFRLALSSSGISK
jgi:formylglycine-generating enzyme required for sulfatase activity